MKFKICHLGREDEVPVNPWSIESRLKKNFQQKYCLAPPAHRSDCNGGIIAAHTVAIGSSLKRISEDGHVLGYKVGFSDLNKSGGIIRPQKIGIRQASTFYGFCAAHDRDLFSCIENAEFVATSEQCLTLAFRAAAKEYYLKKSAGGTSELLSEVDKGKDIHFQASVNEFKNMLSIGRDAGFLDAEHSYDQLSIALESRNFSSVQSLVVFFDGVFPAAFAGGFAPIYSLSGDKIQDLCDIYVRADHMFMTAIGTDTGTAISISWVRKQNSVVELFLKEIEGLEDNVLSSWLMQNAVQSFENCYFKPSWYGGLPIELKEHMQRLLMDKINLFSNVKTAQVDVALDFKLPRIVKVIRVG